MSEHELQRPLVLLDVDGVLHDRVRRDEVRHSQNPEETAAELGVTMIRSHGRLLAVPEDMPELIQNVADVAEIHWLTTWRHRANDEIREHLGIDPLPVIDDGTNDVGFEWKARAAADIVNLALTAGRKVFWIEDFRGAIPNIDPRVHLVDTTFVGFLTDAHLDGTVLSLTSE